MVTPVVGIFTSFTYYAAGYSLTNLIRSQIRQLTRGGYPPHLMVCESFKEADQHFKEATIHKVIPTGSLNIPYSKPLLDKRHEKLAQDTTDALIKMIDEYKLNLIFTHDIIFLNTHYPYGVAVERASKARPDVKWMHWIHSCPSGMNAIWNIKKYGPGHKIVFPNRTDALRVAEQFRGTLDDVWPIHHVKDIREFAEFSGPTNRFIDQYDLMNADIIQIYPASVDRLVAKGIDFLLKTFGAIKKHGKSVRLVICNQWCNVDKHRQTVEAYLEKGKQVGLQPDKEFIFSSRFEAPKWELGLPAKMVAELMMLGNLFMFPTHHESFGLVLPEASLMGGALVVANCSLDMMREITGNNALFWDYGSWHRDIQFKKPGDMPDRYWLGVARVIVGKMQNEYGINLRTHMRKTFNLDAIWNNELHPAMLALLNEAK